MIRVFVALIFTLITCSTFAADQKITDTNKNIQGVKSDLKKDTHEVKKDTRQNVKIVRKDVDKK